MSDLIFPTAVSVKPHLLTFTDGVGQPRFSARFQWAGQSIGIDDSDLQMLRAQFEWMTALIDRQLAQTPALPFGEGRETQAVLLPATIHIEGMDHPHVLDERPDYDL